MGFGVWGLGFGVWGLGFGVWVWGLGFYIAKAMQTATEVIANEEGQAEATMNMFETICEMLSNQHCGDYKNGV